MTELRPYLGFARYNNNPWGTVYLKSSKANLKLICLLQIYKNNSICHLYNLLLFENINTASTSYFELILDSKLELDLPKTYIRPMLIYQYTFKTF